MIFRSRDRSLWSLGESASEGTATGSVDGPGADKSSVESAAKERAATDVVGGPGADKSSYSYPRLAFQSRHKSEFHEVLVVSL